jgi:hypothetical protein
MRNIIKYLAVKNHNLFLNNKMICVTEQIVPSFLWIYRIAVRSNSASPDCKASIKIWHTTNERLVGSIKIEPNNPSFYVTTNTLDRPLLKYSTMYRTELCIYKLVLYVDSTFDLSGMIICGKNGGAIGLDSTDIFAALTHIMSGNDYKITELINSKKKILLTK